MKRIIEQNDTPTTFLLLYGNPLPFQGTTGPNRLSRRRSLAKKAPSPRVAPAIEVSMVKGSNEDPFLEYIIPEPLLDPQTLTKDNILQFRIPVSKGVSVDSVVKELIKEASVLLGSNLNVTESALRKLKENTTTCFHNNVFEYS